MLEALGRTLPLADGVALSGIAAQTENFTGADLKALLYNAQLLAANQALQTSQTGLSSLPGNLKAENKLETTSGAAAEEGEDDSGFHGNVNSVASSISSSTSDRTRVGSHKTDSHSTSSHPYSKPRAPAGDEGLWEFHMSGEMVKQETSQLPKEVSEGGRSSR